MEQIKAIETHYNGYRFRSRLEARWAVFFDALGVDYEYEPEGFDLGDGIYYLPDFYLPEDDVWVEIKGKQLTNEELEKILRFGNAKCDILKHGTRLRVLVGQIPDAYGFGDPDGKFVTVIPCLIYQSPDEARRMLEEFGEHEQQIGPYGRLIQGVWFPNRGDEELLDALVKAKQARFEHGERPA